jgi:hypothetical protein
MPKRSCNMLPLSKKVKVLSLIRREKILNAEVVRIYDKLL